MFCSAKSVFRQPWSAQKKTARAVRLINSLLNGKNKTLQTFPRICRQFSEKLFETKSVQNHFPNVSVDFQIFHKLSENSPGISRRLIDHEFYQKHFPEFYGFPKFSEDFETILFDVHFLFCLAAESVEQDGMALPCPMIS